MGQCCRTISLHTTPGADATEPGSTTPGGETNNHPQEGSADPMPTPDEPQELEGDTLPDMKTSIGISASTANIVMNFDAGDQDIHRKGSTGVDVIDPTALQKVVMAATLGVDTDTDAGITTRDAVDSDSEPHHVHDHVHDHVPTSGQHEVVDSASAKTADLQEVDSVGSHKRITVLLESDPNLDVHQKIKDQYDVSGDLTEDEEEDDDVEDSVADAEMRQQIMAAKQREQRERKRTGSNQNLITADADMSDEEVEVRKQQMEAQYKAMVEEEQHEMEAQMKAMGVNGTTGNDTLDANGDTADGDNMETRSRGKSHLLRQHSSNKWEVDQLKTEQDEMMAHMAALAEQEKGKGSNTTTPGNEGNTPSNAVGNNVESTEFIDRDMFGGSTLL